VPAAPDNVLMTAVEAAEAADGFVSAVTEQTTAAFKIAGVVSVIWRTPPAKAVVDTGALTVALVQVATGDPPNDGKPVTEIKATLLVESAPVKLMVTVDAALITTLLSAIEAV
jgi:hypothetical protein